MAKHPRPEEIVAKLWQADVLIFAGPECLRCDPRDRREFSALILMAA